jgi:hypothetical protein
MNLVRDVVGFCESVRRLLEGYGYTGAERCEKTLLDSLLVCRKVHQERRPTTDRDVPCVTIANDASRIAPVDR